MAKAVTDSQPKSLAEVLCVNFWHVTFGLLRLVVLADSNQGLNLSRITTIIGQS